MEAEKKRIWIAVVVGITLLVAIFIFFSDFKIYAAAVRTHWIALMSSGVSIAITFYEKIRKSIGKYALYVVAVMCVFFSGFQAWQDQYHAVQQSTPHLTARMQRITLTPYGNTQNVFMVLLAKVKNTGAPSSIDEIAIDITLPSGKKVSVVGAEVPKGGFILKNSNGTSTWLPESQNLVLEGQTPIPTGGLIEGFFLGVLKGTDMKEVKLPLWVELSFDDALNKRVTTKFQTSSVPAEIFDASTIMDQSGPQGTKP